MSDAELRQLGLARDPETYRYLKQSKCYEADGIEDAPDYRVVIRVSVCDEA